MDNYQNFMDNFRWSFGDPVKEMSVAHWIQLLKKDNRRDRLHIVEFKLTIADLDRNEAALIAQLRQGLNAQISPELIRQGVSQNLGKIYHLCVIIHSHVEEIQSQFEQQIQQNSKTNNFSALMLMGTELREAETQQGEQQLLKKDTDEKT
ncbi:PEG10: Retrotransposon-derived protein PEG10 [Crotalus adamanteus]|uniref:PEG10: Retrotransposon-derived protein PEG10 n=1 Tax=Crotalus adamanteus TaxID=8729 RepID=A0AAW1BDN1_CROAD